MGTNHTSEPLSGFPREQTVTIPSRFAQARRWWHLNAMTLLAVVGLSAWAFPRTAIVLACLVVAWAVIGQWQWFELDRDVMEDAEAFEAWRQEIDDRLSGR